MPTSPYQSTELTAADLTPAAVAGYLARVELVGVLRRYVKLASADVDTYLGVVHFWAAAGAPAGPFDLPLPRLREHLQLNKATVGDALDRLDRLGVLSYTTSPVKNVSTTFTLGPTGDELLARLAKFQGQILTPKYLTAAGSGSDYNPEPVGVQGQILTPKPAVQVQNLTPNAEVAAVQVQNITPNAKPAPAQRAEKQHAAANEKRATANERANSEHYSISSKGVSLDSTTTQTKQKRARKNDADFPAELVAEFDAWFKRYGVGGRAVGRAETLVEYAKLSTEDRAIVASVTDAFVLAKKDRHDAGGRPADFRPYPVRFLTKRVFAAYADELAHRQPTNQPTSTDATQTTSATRRANARPLDVPAVTGYGFG